MSKVILFMNIVLWLFAYTIVSDYIKRKRNGRWNEMIITNVRRALLQRHGILSRKKAWSLPEDEINNEWDKYKKEHGIPEEEIQRMLDEGEIN